MDKSKVAHGILELARQIHQQHADEFHGDFIADVLALKSKDVRCNKCSYCGRPYNSCNIGKSCLGCGSGLG